MPVDGVAGPARADAGPDLADRPEAAVRAPAEDGLSQGAAGTETTLFVQLAAIDGSPARSGRAWGSRSRWVARSQRSVKSPGASSRVTASRTLRRASAIEIRSLTRKKGCSWAPAARSISPESICWITTGSVATSTYSTSGRSGWGRRPMAKMTCWRVLTSSL